MGNSQAQPPEHAFCDLGAPGTEAMLVLQFYLMPVFFLGVLILGLPLNLLSLWFFSLRLKRWTRSSVLLFNLALADTSWLLALPFLIYYQLEQLRWGLGPHLCKALWLFYHNYFYLSIFFVTCISVDRYVAIVHPLRSLVLLGHRQSYLLCAAAWVVTMVLSLPVANMVDTQRCPRGNRTICSMYVMLEEPWESLAYSLCCSCTGFLFPLIAICYCYLCSVKELYNLPRLTLPHCRWHRLTRAMTTVLILFTLFYLPYHLTRNASIIMRVVYRDDPVSWRPADLVFSLEMCLCSLNTVINPLFNCFMGRQFRKEILDTIVGPFIQQRSGTVLASPLPKENQRTMKRGMCVTPL